jgi:S1-C subfamily serine protease
MTDFEWGPPEWEVQPPPPGPSPSPSASAYGMAPSPAPGPPSRLFVVVALVAALIGAGIGALVARTTGTGGSGQTVVIKYSGNTSKVVARPADVQGILAKVLPAVVTIKSTVVSQNQGNGGFFGFGGGSQTSLDEGTGMIITPDGEIVTNNHVVSGASTITVNLNGTARDLPAHVIATDPSDDVALIQVNGESGLPTVSFGHSAAVKVGDGVVAIGNALGLSGGPTVTAGIISAEGRGLTIQDPNSGTIITLANLLQTDAAINPGNSGGPLVDSRGRVIGMNSDEAVNAGDAQAQNIGFAIAADTISRLVPQLRKGGTLTIPRAYLGIQGGDETPQLQQEYGLVPSTGALVETVGANTPASKAGLQPGDVIVSIDGTGISAWTDLTQDLRGYDPGQSVTLGLYRGKSLMNIQVTLGTSPSRS